MVALARGVVLAALGVVHVFLAAVVLVSILLMGLLGMVFLFFPTIRLTRAWTGLARRLAYRWSGVEIAGPYRPVPGPPVLRPDGYYREGRTLYKKPDMPRFARRLDWIFKDPATWRDLAWLISYSFGGPLLPLVPAALLASGGALVFAWQPIALAGGELVRVLLGVLLGVLGVAVAPWVLRLHGLWIRGLLGPTEKSLLANQVRHLVQTRTETVDSQAAQLRRIERDLHDGAQARLVAVGMTLGTAEALVDTDPAAAEALIAKSREATAEALAELRRLVRGIRPPVLADRGLAEALRALALDSPLDVTVVADLPAGCHAPVEAAVYFAASELLTNAIRHGGARKATIAVGMRGGTLLVTVTDDGCGGADPRRGSGLHGIERRLAAFDGTLGLDSPPGGPTVVTLEIPGAADVVRPATAREPRWKTALRWFCYGSFALPLIPLGLVPAAFKVVGVPDATWTGLLGLTRPAEWGPIIGWIVLGAALLATGTVLGNQRARARKQESDQ
jgi:signal transduction histidine kinase